MVKLFRHFSFASLVLIVLAVFAISYFHRMYEKNDLLKMGESHNLALTQTFSNIVWPQFHSFTASAKQLDDDALRGHSDTAILNHSVRDVMRNTNLVRLNILQLDGRTIFSTDPKLVGNNQSNNAGFLSARQGKVFSMLTHFDQFSALEGEITGRDILLSYVAMRRNADAPIEGVLELYTDVTAAQGNSENQQRFLLLMVTTVLSILYVIFVIIIKRAEGLLRKQSEQQRLIEQNLEHLSTHDALTNLPNRMLMLDRIKQSLASVERRGIKLAVISLDIDNFKSINDSLCHHIGDKVLQAVAKRLTDCLRKGDSAARIGSNQFVISLPDIHASAVIAKIVQKLHSVISSPLEIEGHNLYLTTSSGIALYPEHGQDVEMLMRNAGMAMYSAKQLGRNRHQIFVEQMSLSVKQRVKIEREMRHALDNNEFVVYYQPIVDLNTGTIIGAEALLRWPNDHGPWVTPTEFIPLAEESGLIVPLSEWVLSEACNQMKVWREHGLNEVGLSVNLSPHHFSMAVNLSPHHFATTGLADIVSRVIEQSGIEPMLLHLEITEGLMMGMSEVVLSNFEELRELGIQFSLDDFGTGYSSLGYLRRFSIHQLKIDRVFVQELPDSTDNIAIVTAIIALGNSLSLTVVAEGIETEAQLKCLQQLGCHQVQGFLLSRPLPAAEFMALILKKRDMRIILSSPT